MADENVLKRPFLIETDRLMIRRLKIEDAQDIFDYASDPVVPRYLPWSHHNSVDDTVEFLNTVIAGYKDGEIQPWGIELKETGKIIGTCGFVWWNKEESKAELGYALSQIYWNRGIMTEAVKLIIDFGFELMHLNRIEGYFVIGNLASGKVMQKVGMQYEGHLRNYRKFKGEFKDVKMYSILKSEYRDLDIYNNGK